MARLYTYFRSSAAYRVRIALALKDLPFEAVPVHLARQVQQSVEYRRVNPGGAVPCWADTDLTLAQSLAIIEYLDERHPARPLLPADPVGRARVREIALDIACDIHPLNNLRVLNYLTGTFGISKEQKAAWYRHWVESGLAVVEARVAGRAGRGTFCYGETPTLADCCLIPQLFNARRFDCRLDHLPTLCAIERACLNLPAFVVAAPDRQPDVE